MGHEHVLDCGKPLVDLRRLEVGIEFVLFGKNAMALPRLYFDPEAGTAREVMPGQR